jgi:hypothetical protein
MDGYAVGDDGNCHSVEDSGTTTTDTNTTDTNTTDTDTTDTNTTDTTDTTDTSVEPGRECETFPAASGTVGGKSLTFNTFAWSNVGQGVLVLGFKDYSDTACELVQNHVSGTDYWIEGDIMEMNLSGDLRSGATVEFTVPRRTPPMPAEVNGTASVSVISGEDFWGEQANSGSAMIDSFGAGAALEMSGLSLGFADGSSMGSAVTACYCAEVELFWSTDIDDTDSGDTEPAP